MAETEASARRCVLWQLFRYFDKSHILSKTSAAIFWATVGKKLGYFLFQHLVTLLLLFVLNLPAEMRNEETSV